jgi:hypothetical protein
MSGPENIPQHGFGENPIIGYLNMDDPEEKAWFEEMEEDKRRFREKYPTPESVASDYYEGYVDLSAVRANFSEEELAVVWKELERLKESEE